MKVNLCHSLPLGPLAAKHPGGLSLGREILDLPDAVDFDTPCQPSKWRRLTIVHLWIVE